MLMAGQGAAVGEHLFSVDLEALGDAGAVLDVIVQGLNQDASAAEIEVAAATTKLQAGHANVDRALKDVRSVTEKETDALTSLAASAEAEVLNRPALFSSINDYAAVYGALLQLESDVSPVTHLFAMHPLPAACMSWPITFPCLPPLH
jgi:hypothetical protein